MREAMKEEMNGAVVNHLSSIMNYVTSMGVCLDSEWSETCQRVSEHEGDDA